MYRPCAVYQQRVEIKPPKRVEKLSDILMLIMKPTNS